MVPVISYTGELVDILSIGDFPPGEHSLDITVTDVHGQNVTHPTIMFTRPPLLEVQCSVHDSQTINCTSTTVVESQMCFIDDGPLFNCSLPRGINELAATYNLTLGDHNLTIITMDEFAQSDITLLTFTVFRKLCTHCQSVVHYRTSSTVIHFVNRMCFLLTLHQFCILSHNTAYI